MDERNAVRLKFMRAKKKTKSKIKLRCRVVGRKNLSSRPVSLKVQSAQARCLLELRSLWASENRFYQKKWKRSLPFGEMIVDRWVRAKALGFGKNSSIYDSALVFGRVKVGASTWIGPFCILDGTGGLEIGDFCSISAGTQIYTHDTVLWARSGGRHSPQRAKVKIGSRCYLGPNVIISKGVTIGPGCVIGANSFVNRNIPAGVKAWGNPVRIITPLRKTLI